ncbi:PQQ-like beta-propeller repeat protein [Phaeobacter sp. J2-8]|uniref:PQQ-like beta-propeller repeat protein n=1 Tax=Phaeobacter sp. J2-8 TaxID=2931394 RepID=UPI001FD25D1B|nr:PQQ-like beta-propeller repeat protein [Phaeobacter sp. J2-8]
MRTATIRIILGLAAVSVFAACESRREIILPGKREAIRPDEASLAAEAATTADSLSLAAATRNATWLQGHGTPATRTNHPAFGTALTPLWSANIGQGDSRKFRITADPVVADGRIYTLDSDALVTATSTGGATLWTRDLAPARDGGGQGSGGGLAIGGGRLYVTSGYGSITALDLASGAEIWSQKLQASGTASPSYADGLVYLVAGDRTAWAIEADTGRIRWQLEGLEDINNVHGGPAPALTDKFVIFGYGSGDVQGAFRKGGLSLWNATIAGQRNGFAINRVSDITGDPVVVGDTVYVANHTGRLVALNTGSGSRKWTARDAAVQPVWVTGGGVFFVSDRNDLKRVNVSDGAEVWSAELPGYTSQRPRKRDRIFGNYGPILAGGGLYVAGGDGLLRAYDPNDGQLLKTAEIPGGATTNPVVVNGVMYIVTKKGQLQAYGG